jgi:DDE superfamily endonuclease
MIGEVPVRGRTGDAGRGRRLFDGRGLAGCHQVTGGGDQRVTSSLLLLGAAGELIGSRHLLAERRIDVDHVTVWLDATVHPRCWPTPPDSPGIHQATVGAPTRPTSKSKGCGRYVYRAADQHGQVIDVLVTVYRDAVAARRVFTRALRTPKVIPSDVVTDAAAVYPGVLDGAGPRGVAPRRAVRKHYPRPPGATWHLHTTLRARRPAGQPAAPRIPRRTPTGLQ